MKAHHQAVWATTVLTLAALSISARADSDRERGRERDRDRERGANVFVNCAAGETIARALTRGDDRKSLVIRIQGTCSENILIDRSDITLVAAATGATVSGPDPATDVVRVTGSRVTIDGITVTGGRNGITADSAAGILVRNVLVQGTGRNGITYARGASGIVDGSTVTGSARDGVAIDAASGTVINSTISQNGRMGVGVFTNGSARIGIDNFNNPAGNVISANASNGIHIIFGSTASIATNQITGNGTSADPTVTKIGINVVSASADIIGGNTISGNVGAGINIIRSSAGIGDPGFGIGTVNTITGNGNPASQSGVFAFLGSSLTIRDAIITGNVGSGVTLSLNSSAQISSTQIQNNLATVPGTGDGIRLVFGSGLFAATPVGSVTGNAGFGLNCTDGESSVINTGFLGVGPNGLGGVSPSCTGF